MGSFGSRCARVIHPRHSVEAGIAEKEAEGGAEGGFAEKSFAEGLIEARILEVGAEDDIDKIEGREKRLGKIGEEGHVTASLEVDTAGGVDAVAVEDGVIEEDALENGEGAAEGGGDHDGNNGGNNTQGKAEAEVEGDLDNDQVDQVDQAEWVEDEVAAVFATENDTKDKAAKDAAYGEHVVGDTGDEGLEAIKEGGVAQGGVREEGIGEEGIVKVEEGIVEGVITEGGIAQGIAEKGVAQGAEEWVVREGAAEESIAAESVAKGGGVKEGVALVGEEMVREQIENCVHKLSPGLLGVTGITADMSHCNNALLVALITHTHKN